MKLFLVFCALVTVDAAKGGGGSKGGGSCKNTKKCTLVSEEECGGASKAQVKQCKSTCGQCEEEEAPAEDTTKASKKGGGGGNKKSKGGSCADANNCKIKSAAKCGDASQSDLKKCKATCSNCPDEEETSLPPTPAPEDDKASKKGGGGGNKKSKGGSCADANNCKIKSAAKCGEASKSDLKKCKATCSNCDEEETSLPPTPAPEDDKASKKGGGGGNKKSKGGSCADANNCKIKSAADCATAKKNDVKKCKATCDSCTDDTTEDTTPPTPAPASGGGGGSKNKKNNGGGSCKNTKKCTLVDEAECGGASKAQVKQCKATCGCEEEEPASKNKNTNKNKNSAKNKAANKGARMLEDRAMDFFV